MKWVRFAFVCLISTSLLAGCGAEFTSSCKEAINTTIDLRDRTAVLSGSASAPCDLTTSRADKGEDLAAACDALQESTTRLTTVCGDKSIEALEKALMRERQY